MGRLMAHFANDDRLSQFHNMALDADAWAFQAHVLKRSADILWRPIEKAYEAREPALPGLKANPRFDNLRSDPRYTSLLRRVGLP